MLYAVIRNDHDSLHFIGEVNTYNLQTLQQHVRGMSAEGSPLRLSIKVDPADTPAFTRFSTRWMDRLEDAGIAVHVEPCALRVDRRGPGVRLRS